MTADELMARVHLGMCRVRCVRETRRSGAEVIEIDTHATLEPLCVSARDSRATRAVSNVVVVRDALRFGRIVF